MIKRNRRLNSRMLVSLSIFLWMGAIYVRLLWGIDVKSWTVWLMTVLAAFALAFSVGWILRGDIEDRRRTKAVQAWRNQFGGHND